jgi:hypothetical protein
MQGHPKDKNQPCKLVLINMFSELYFILNGTMARLHRLNQISQTEPSARKLQVERVDKRNRITICKATWAASNGSMPLIAFWHDTLMGTHLTTIGSGVDIYFC